jgi:hypothetical protein
MPDSLTACHAILGRMIGPDMEPMSVIERVEEHRWHWRPARPRVVLLAESHVYTRSVELQHTLRPVPQLPRDLPRGFVRLVYCLGYGEDALLDAPIATSRNSGTPQFWKLFYSCLYPVTRNEDFAPIQAARTPLTARVANKIAMLESLKACGVWLVDASIAALYIPGHPKPAPQLIARALHASWDGYIRSVIAEATPQAILCIGLGVARALRSRLDRLGVPWAAVPQPNARLSAADHFRIFGMYRGVCAEPESVRTMRAAWGVAAVSSAVEAASGPSPQRVRAEQGFAADRLQRPLLRRCRFQRQLKPGVRRR